MGITLARIDKMCIRDRSLELARLVQDGIRQVEEGMGMTLPSASLGYNRLMSHLR